MSEYQRTLHETGNCAWHCPYCLDVLPKTIVADPPWEPAMSKIHGKKWVMKNKATPQKHYPVLSVDEICDMSPETEPQAHLWLWCLNQHTDWGHKVAEAWGFQVWQMLTWCKPGLGTGRFQANSEQVLICRKGKRQGNPFGMTGGTWFKWPRGKHSQKPEALYELVEQCSPRPYLEMFARRPRLGWMVVGNEVTEPPK